MLLIASACLGLAACGEDSDGPPSADQIASQFEDRVSEQTDADAIDVECRDAAEDYYYDCTGEIAGFPSEFQLKVEGDTIDLVTSAERPVPYD